MTTWKCTECGYDEACYVETGGVGHPVNCPYSLSPEWQKIESEYINLLCLQSVARRDVMEAISKLGKIRQDSNAARVNLDAAKRVLKDFDEAVRSHPDNNTTGELQ